MILPPSPQSSITVGPEDQILAGPVLRRTEAHRLVFWLCSREPLQFRLILQANESPAQPIVLTDDGHQQIQIGTRCFIHLLDVKPDAELPLDQFIHYDLQWQRNPDSDWVSMSVWAPGIDIDGADLPRLVVRSKLDKLLHGSCRKPHSSCEDGLVAAWQWLAQDKRRLTPARWPAALMMTGDQIYADDVAGPMLSAIHQLIEQLGLFAETITGAEVNNSAELFASPKNFYRRDELLPDIKNNDPLQKRFFEGARKPVFTSANADNHLITLAEVFAMYLLVWSPVGWRNLEQQWPELLPEHQQRYEREREQMTAFVAGLDDVRRLMAQLPVLMIFDDHDVTDDWNLSADWEKTAYGHPFSKRIIGNALVAYLLCQGWGNQPDNFDATTMDLVRGWTQNPDCDSQDALIDYLMGFHQWHYNVPTEPMLLVMDTRTRRWRSESNARKPSGLLDWEALTELQNELMNHSAVVLVSPAPVFGVKLIEVMQKLFTLIGKPLLVDAENWMAHRGTANVILNIFTHTRTPKNFVILSGDVHYSFVYGIRVRSERGNPHLWQVTSSGLKNAFPKRLLDTLDRLNRWLYAPWSPLNWLTKRRRLEIIPHRHLAASRGERLLNQAGVGYVEFADDGRPVKVEQISRQQIVSFDIEEPRSGKVSAAVEK